MSPAESEAIAVMLVDLGHGASFQRRSEDAIVARCVCGWSSEVTAGQAFLAWRGHLDEEWERRVIKAGTWLA